MPRRKNAMIPGALNRLRHEKSPYLLQHVKNPVDWHPWGGGESFLPLVNR
jgi:uncharacterized protein YyaL (SSP411 family)